MPKPNMKGAVMHINAAVIEVTRRCNMTCEHCLRGKAQNMNQTKENIDKFFGSVGYISTLSFTGGEPSLAPEMIEYARQSAEKHGCEVGSFFIVTNGKNISEPFVMACLRWWAYCNDNECSNVELSQDDFHDDETQLNYNLLKGLSFFSKRRPLDARYTLEQGRGKDFGTGRTVSEELLYVEEEEESFNITEGLIYLNCKGELIKGCDWSFRNQSRHKICDVGELTLGTLEEAGAEIDYIERD